MDFDLSDDQQAIQRLCREFARDVVAPQAQIRDREAAFRYAIERQMAESGLLGLPFPQEYAGAGADTVSYPLAVMEIAHADASVAITLAAHPGFAGPKTFRKRISSASVVVGAPLPPFTQRNSIWRICSSKSSTRGSRFFRAAGEKNLGRDSAVAASFANLYAGEMSRRVVNEAIELHDGTAQWMSIRFHGCTVIKRSMRSAKGPMTSNAS